MNMREQTPINWFSYIFSTQDLYIQVAKIIQKPFYLNNPKQKEIWNDLEQNVLTKYRYISKSGPLSDKVIYTALHQYMNTHYYPIYGFPNNESSGRSISRVIDIQQLLNTLSPNVYIHKYVDIGCSEGGITAELGRTLECGKENVYGIDILPPEKNKHQHLFQYIQIEETAQHLPFEDDSVCFVTAIMCLHHIKQANTYIQEVFRILKPGGVFIIQEHNTETEYDRIKLDILHGMYCMVWAKEGCQENPLFCEEYVAWYKSKTQWDTLIRNTGFTGCVLPPTIKYKAIPRNNTHHNFWAMYQKPR